MAEDDRESKIRTLASYIPTQVIRRVLQSSPPLSPPETASFPASVLFVDISGFTILADNLAKEKGHEGMEELNRIINSYFEHMISIITNSGGDVVKFAGDAIFAIWPATLLNEDLPQVAIRAASCATGLLSTDWSKLPGAVLNGQPVQLKVHIGLGAGEITSMHVGGVLSRCEFVICGDALRQIAKAVDLAKPGQVVASTEGWGLIKDRCRGPEVPDSGGYMLLEEISDYVPPLAISPRDYVLERLLKENSDEAIDILRKYTPGAVRERIDKNQDWIADLRKVTILFIKLDGLDYTRPHSVRTLNSAMTVVQEILRRYEGAVSRLQVDDKGTVLKAAYGLPPFSHEDDPARGLMAAMDMRPRLQSMGVTPYIGITTGLVFCGTVGSNIRCEYTTVGAPVNLAARLMQNAKEGLLCDSVTYHSAKNRIRMESLGSIKVKGRSEPVAIYRPATETDSAQIQLGKMFGRLQEKQEIEQRLINLLDGQGGVVELVGDIGIGKSRLVAELLQMPQMRRLSHFKGNADPISKESFGVWKPIFKDLLNCKDKIEDDARRNQLYDEICKLIDMTEDEIRAKGSSGDGTPSDSSAGAGSGAAASAARAMSPSMMPINTAKAILSSQSATGRRASTITGRPIQSTRRSSLLQKPTKLRESTPLASLAEAAERTAPSGTMSASTSSTNVASQGLMSPGPAAHGIMSPATLVSHPPSPSPATIGSIPGQLPQSDKISHRAAPLDSIHEAPNPSSATNTSPALGPRTQSVKKLAGDAGASMGGRLGSGSATGGIPSPSALPAHLGPGGKPRRASVWQGVFGPKQAPQSTKPKGRLSEIHEDSAATMVASPSQANIAENAEGPSAMAGSLQGNQNDPAHPGSPEPGMARTPSAFLGGHADMKSLVPLLNPILGTDFPDNPTTLSIPENARSKLLVMLLNQIFIATYTKPVLIVIEDIQWMDTLSWNLLFAISRLPKPILIFLTSRPLGDAESMELKKLNAHRIVLGHLTKDDISQLACQTFHIPNGHLPVILEKAIWDRSLGNPLVAEQLVAFMQESGTVSVSDDQLIIRNAKDINSHPETLGDVITARVDKLTPSQQMVIRVASVIGSKFKFDLLRSIYPISRPEAQILDDLQTLVNSGFIEENNSAKREFTFKSKVEQACYMMTPYSQKRRLHYLIAEWYESSTSEVQQYSFSELAYHWENADERLKAVDYYQKAAFYALSHHQYQNTIEYFEKAIKLQPETNDIETRAHWLVGMSEALLGVGQLNRAFDTLQETLRLYQRPLPSETPRLYLAIVQQRALLVAHRFLPGSMFALESEKAEKTLASRCYVLLCGIYMAQQQYREAHLCNMYAMDLAELRSKETPELAISNADAALLAQAANSEDLAAAHIEYAVQITSRLQQSSCHIYALLQASIYYTCLGNWDAADDALEEAMQVAEETEDLVQLDRCRIECAYRSFFRGDLSDALGSSNYALNAAAERYDLLTEAHAAVIGAFVCLVGGNLADTKTKLAKATRNIIQMEPCRDTSLVALHHSITALAKLHAAEDPSVVLSAALTALEVCATVSTPLGYIWTFTLSAILETLLTLADPNAAANPPQSPAQDRARQQEDGDAAAASQSHQQSKPSSPSRTEIMAHATRALGLLKSIANVCPIAKPYHQLWAGLQAALSGAEGKSRQLLEDSNNSAEDLQLNIVQALTSLYLARFHEPVRKLYSQRAKTLFNDMGASYYSTRVLQDGTSSTNASTADIPSPTSVRLAS
eukprot:TRINITY_DN2275_c0_g3_i3.p1 TRINITY_DN2275_c0_g3~~TRINITY_DN2275_c0_g3_i3.p1  ORF type:complete len:1744 (-),score=350.99 TRINITY_DN2275_c0_g3_i3:418-5649(-)